MVFTHKKYDKIKHEAYVTNVNENESIGTHWIASNISGDNGTCFQ